MSTRQGGMRGAVLVAALLLALPARGDDAGDWWGHYKTGARLVRLADGKKLNLYCEGTGRPVVMMESGLGAGAWAWRKVQAAIARVTKTCVYDRAGYWGSPATNGPRDAGAEADDLAALLKAAHLPAPYVIVGHSYGGYIARLYAGRHTRDLAGLVLVDPSSAHQAELFATVAPHLTAADHAAEAQVEACAAGAPPKDCILRPPPADIPPQMKDWFIAAQTRGYASAMKREYDAMPGLSSDQLDREKKSLGAIPFVLLNQDAGKLAVPGSTPEEVRATTALWLKLHQQIMDISSDSDLRIVPGAGHNIPSDRPQAVIEALTEVVKKVRGH